MSELIEFRENLWIMSVILRQFQVTNIREHAPFDPEERKKEKVEEITFSESWALNWIDRWRRHAFGEKKSSEMKSSISALTQSSDGFGSSSQGNVE